MYPFEDIIGGFVAAVAFTPAVNNTLVVSENFEMNVGGTRVEESKGE